MAWVSLSPAEPPGHGKAPLVLIYSLLLCLSQQICGASSSLLICLGSGLTPLEYLWAKAGAHTAGLRLFFRYMTRLKGGFIQIAAQGLWDRDLVRLMLLESELGARQRLFIARVINHQQLSTTRDGCSITCTLGCHWASFS